MPWLVVISLSLLQFTKRRFHEGSGLLHVDQRAARSSKEYGYIPLPRCRLMSIGTESDAATVACY